MFSQLFGLVGAQSPTLLVFIDLFCTAITGGSVSRVLRRERRRRLRAKTAASHYTRSVEDFPELAGG